ncbi:MAG: M23 family metallopeptidase [Lachnospiraceae bacterium]|nr:M23 family metallopeptidase [Lachnospiraceae bacterium]
MVRENLGYGKKKNSKGMIYVALACFLCLSVLACGAVIIGKNGNSKEKETENIVDLNAQKEQEETTDEAPVAVDGEVVKNTEQEDEAKGTGTMTQEDEKNQNSNKTSTSGDGTSNNVSNVITDEVAGQVSENTNGQAGDTSSDATNDVVDVNAMVSALSFGEGSTLQWPVNGNVILDYSMDSTIYFSTLDSYRCNPAIVIQSETGTSVYAGATGVVKEVSENEEIGNYVVVGIGDGYELTYGQLDNISVDVGTKVEPDTTIGVVGEVTRYYKNEGTNVYFEMTKDGNPTDPLDYLE